MFRIYKKWWKSKIENIYLEKIKKKLKILLNEVYGSYYVKVSHNDIRNIIKEYVKDYDINNNEIKNFNKLLNLYKYNDDKKFNDGLKQKIKGSNGGSGIFESLTSYIKKWEINSNSMIQIYQIIKFYIII